MRGVRGVRGVRGMRGVRGVHGGGGAPVKAHVLRGPCALPDPEDTVRALLDPKQAVPQTKHVAVQVIHYKRARADFEAVAFKRGDGDTLHGRVQDFTRRSEAQKRGNQHEHYIYWMESCGIVRKPSNGQNLRWRHLADR